ncbi:MAG: hypothetical protein ACQEXQ_16310 [Bacillota bacterium]
MNYKTKSVNFNLDDPKDKALHGRLKLLEHGEFSEISKQMWMKELFTSEETEKLINERLGSKGEQHHAPTEA